jgi:hypothetical protein
MHLSTFYFSFFSFWWEFVINCVSFKNSAIANKLTTSSNLLDEQSTITTTGDFGNYELNSINELTDKSDELQQAEQSNKQQRLVLEDQAVHYAKYPLTSYMQAGYGVIATLFVMLLFYLVHLFRLQNGNNK